MKYMYMHALVMSVMSFLLQLWIFLFESKQLVTINQLIFTAFLVVGMGLLYKFKTKRV